MIRAALLALLLLAPVAHAADPPPSPKRPVPDYDGIPGPPPRALDVVAWVPRVVLFPVYVVSEFVIRRPLGWLVVHAERGNWPSELLSFFTFGGKKEVGIVPTFYADLGFKPTAGFYMFWNNLFTSRHSIRLRASAWTDGYNLAFADRWRIGDASRLQLRGKASRRPDNVFYGIGPRSLDDNRSRFGLDELSVDALYDWPFSFGDQLGFQATLRDNDFRDEVCCSGLRLRDAIARGFYPTPPGFPDGYTAFLGRIGLILDSRDPYPASQTGLRFVANVELGTTLQGDATWIKGGGTAGAYWDIGGLGRVLILTASASVAEPLDGEVPFLELIDFGGGPSMPGFRPDRLLGRSGASASLRYEWPVWAALAGSLQVEIGNVFGPDFEDFEPGLLRLSTALALRTIGPVDHGLMFVIGIGTETFDDGAELTQLRLGIGGTYGF